MAQSLFTSESVTEGHPDKVCDQISDAVLDAVIAQDENCRVACETMVKTGYVILAGEISTTATINIPPIVRKTIRDIGYVHSDIGFDGNTCGLLSSLEEQSPDIRQGVDKGEMNQQGAGDQGMMFGYACNETPEMMPLPIMLAHQLSKRLAQVRKESVEGIDFIYPDGKTQVSVLYDNDQPVAVDTVVISTHHAASVTQDKLAEVIRALVIDPIIPKNLRSPKMKIHINPTGAFLRGGPYGDAGLTGRKIIIDTYGGMGRHGGGAFSGKDPSKVDRSACYYARYIAKHIVMAQLAQRCEVQLAYAIGVAKPVSLLVQTFGTGSKDDQAIADAIPHVFDACPGNLIEELNLRRPIYQQTAAYGHFGRDAFPWEQTPHTEKLKAALH